MNIWLDEDNIGAVDINVGIRTGIENSEFFVPLLTSEYVNRISDSRLSDNVCFVELTQAMLSKTRNRIKPLVVEAGIVWKDGLPRDIGDENMLHVRPAREFIIPAKSSTERQVWETNEQNLVTLADSAAKALVEYIRMLLSESVAHTAVSSNGKCVNVLVESSEDDEYEVTNSPSEVILHVCVCLFVCWSVLECVCVYVSATLMFSTHSQSLLMPSPSETIDDKLKEEKAMYGSRFENMSFGIAVCLFVMSCVFTYLQFRNNGTYQIGTPYTEVVFTNWTGEIPITSFQPVQMKDTLNKRALAYSFLPLQMSIAFFSSLIQGTGSWPFFNWLPQLLRRNTSLGLQYSLTLISFMTLSWGGPSIPIKTDIPPSSYYHYSFSGKTTAFYILVFLIGVGLTLNMRQLVLKIHAQDLMRYTFFLLARMFVCIVLQGLCVTYVFLKYGTQAYKAPTTAFLSMDNVQPDNSQWVLAFYELQFDSSIFFIVQWNIFFLALFLELVFGCNYITLSLQTRKLPLLGISVSSCCANILLVSAIVGRPTSEHSDWIFNNLVAMGIGWIMFVIGPIWDAFRQELCWVAQVSGRRTLHPAGRSHVVYISSASFKDFDALKREVQMLDSRIIVWDDDNSEHDDHWKRRVRRAINDSRLFVPVITTDYILKISDLRPQGKASDENICFEELDHAMSHRREIVRPLVIERNIQWKNGYPMELSNEKCAHLTVNDDLLLPGFKATKRKAARDAQVSKKKNSNQEMKALIAAAAKAIVEAVVPLLDAQEREN